MPNVRIRPQYVIFGAVAAVIGVIQILAWQAEQPASASPEAVRWDVARAAMVEGMDSLLPAEHQEAVCDGLTDLIDSPHIADTRLYSGNDSEAVAMRQLLATVGRHGLDAAGVTTEEEKELIFAGQHGVETFCASR